MDCSLSVLFHSRSSALNSEKAQFVLFSILRDQKSKQGDTGNSRFADISCDIYSSYEAGRGGDDALQVAKKFSVGVLSAAPHKSLHFAHTRTVCEDRGVEIVIYHTVSPRKRLIGPKFILQHDKDPNHKERRLKVRATDGSVPTEFQITLGDGSESTEELWQALGDSKKKKAKKTVMLKAKYTISIDLM